MENFSKTFLCAENTGLGDICECWMGDALLQYHTGTEAAATTLQQREGGGGGTLVPKLGLTEAT